MVDLTARGAKREIGSVSDTASMTNCHRRGVGTLTLGLELLGHYSLGDLAEQVLLVGLQVSLELGVPLDDPVDGDLVQETLDTGHDEGNLNLCAGSGKEMGHERQSRGRDKQVGPDRFVSDVPVAMGEY